MKNRHPNYELLNLLGYGLAKYGIKFVHEFGFETKTAFYSDLIAKGIADSVGTIKNRQDLLDPFFDNNRKGWWQKGDTYKHRKTLVDSLYGDLDVKSLSSVIKLHILQVSKLEKNNYSEEIKAISPILRSAFNQLQVTGQKAELFFSKNYKSIEEFKDGKLEDARLLGDGYDFQITFSSKYYLVDIKGIRSNYGGIRLTEKEYVRAVEYEDDYGLVVVSELDTIPKMKTIFNPSKELAFTMLETEQKRVAYHSGQRHW